MDKVKACIERITVIKGVNYGQISNEQLQDVYILYSLSEQQQEQVNEWMRQIGICPIPESEMIRARQAKSISYEAPKQDTPNEVTCEERFQSARRACMEALESEDRLLAQYQEELLLLKNAIKEYSNNSTLKAESVITRAVMDISSYRVRDVRAKGWVCGTYMSRVRQIFRNWLCCHFAATDMAELIGCCTSTSPLTTKDVERLLVLLHNTPRTLVHPRYSSLFEE